MNPDAVTGYSDFAREGDDTMATAHYESGKSRRVKVRVAVEREHRRGGELIASGEVASSDDGSVHIGRDARL